MPCFVAEQDTFREWSMPWYTQLLQKWTHTVVYSTTVTTPRTYVCRICEEQHARHEHVLWNDACIPQTNQYMSHDKTDKPSKKHTSSSYAYSYQQFIMHKTILIHQIPLTTDSNPDIRTKLLGVPSKRPCKPGKRVFFETKSSGTSIFLSNSFRVLNSSPASPGKTGGRSPKMVLIWRWSFEKKI